MVLLLILVSAVTFVIFNVFPSTDPAALRAGRQPTPRDRSSAIREDLGLDRPLIVQFGDYIYNVFAHQDFGRSYVNNTGRARPDPREPAGHDLARRSAA